MSFSWKLLGRGVSCGVVERGGLFGGRTNVPERKRKVILSYISLLVLSTALLKKERMTGGAGVYHTQEHEEIGL